MRANPKTGLDGDRHLVTGAGPRRTIHDSEALSGGAGDATAEHQPQLRRRAKTLNSPLERRNNPFASASISSGEVGTGRTLAAGSQRTVTAYQAQLHPRHTWLQFLRLTPFVLVLLALIISYSLNSESVSLPLISQLHCTHKTERLTSTVIRSVFVTQPTAISIPPAVLPPLTSQDSKAGKEGLPVLQRLRQSQRGFYNPIGRVRNGGASEAESDADTAARISSMALADEARRVADEFEYGKEAINNGVQEFLKEMAEGMSKDGTSMSQIPTYVTAVPNGTERGLYMAVDLGGTNFRVCSIQLHGNTTFSLTQSKVAIPRELMVAKTAKELFAFLAKQIELFLKAHHGDHFLSHIQRVQSEGGTVRDEDIFDLGFTFSFPVLQQGINKGTLIRWTKGFDIQDAIGKDVCALLQTEIDALNLPVRVAALVNDTVGTLMARSYTSPGKTGTLLGAIFGTGTNGAYVEKLDRITKLTAAASRGEIGAYDTTTGEMIVNTEWGSFDNALAVLPNTPYDIALDADSVNPGIQMFEKRVSGMFLGEIVRRALVGMLEKKGEDGQGPAVPLFRDENSGLNDVHSTTNIAQDSPLFKIWGLDTAFLSLAAGDASEGLKTTRQALDRDLGVSAASYEDAEAVRLVCGAVGRRAARLAAVAIAAVVVQSGRLHVSTVPEADGEAQPAAADEDDDLIDVGVDGSLVEFYPGFEGLVREALREVEGVGEAGERRVRIGIAKDGSGVGAALIALVASRQERRMSVAV